MSLSRIIKPIIISLLPLLFVAVFLFRPFEPVLVEGNSPDTEQVFNPDAEVGKTSYRQELLVLRTLSRSEPHESRQRIAQLQEQMQRDELPIETAYRYMVMVNIALHSENNQKVGEYTQQLLKLAHQNDLVWLEASALVEQAIEFAKKGETNRGITAVETAIALAERIGYEDLLVKAYNTAGALYNIRNDFISAQRYFHQGILLGQKYPQHIYNSKLLSNMGLVYIHLEEWQSALEFFSLSLNAYQSSELVENGVPLILHANRTYIYYRLGQAELARLEYQQLEQYLDEVSTSRQQVVALKALADVQMVEENFPAALATVQKCLTHPESSRYPLQLGQCYLTKAQTLFEMDRYEEVLTSASAALNYFEQIGSRSWLIRTYRFLAQAYESYGLPDQALQMFQLYYQKDKQLLFDRRQSELLLVEQQFSNQQLMQERDLLNTQNQLAQLTLEKQKLRNRTLIVMGVLCALVLIVLVRRVTRDNRELETISNTDPLTRLKNRRCYEKWLKEADEEDPQSGFVFALMDLDKFKQVNDQHGHDVGDEVLVEVASRIQHNLPDGSVAIRWGGEEFACLIPYQPDCEQILEHIRQAVADTPISTLAGDVKSSVTIGAVGPVMRRDLEMDSNHFSAADNALYSGKEGGRNQVVFSPSL
ncbi:diguanylate cyclase domain-containing protein [Vibrio sp. TBV020]|uniref:tetratricopeptide repeat-containing diguanylate cyclase n=1 Tax=Vibrio sp. TBV020 TaxID=3137398 RepID=UPI0038CD6158